MCIRDRYVDNYYGTPLEFVNEKLNEGINVILEIETQGALKVKAVSYTHLIFKKVLNDINEYI